MRGGDSSKSRRWLDTQYGALREAVVARSAEEYGPWWPFPSQRNDSAVCRSATRVAGSSRWGSLSVRVMAVRVVSRPASAGRFCWHQPLWRSKSRFYRRPSRISISWLHQDDHPLYIQHYIMHVQKGCDPASKVSSSYKYNLGNTSQVTGLRHTIRYAFRFAGLELILERRCVWGFCGAALILRFTQVQNYPADQGGV